MTFGLSGAAIAGLAVGAGGIASSLISSNASKQASDAQVNANNQALGIQKDQFAQLTKLLAPYVQTGNQAQTAQGNLIGLNGQGAEQGAVNDIQSGATFKALNAQGQDAILQNSAATGGLRGGNVQAALGQFSPALLNQLLTQRFGQLGGLAGVGENAAAGTGNAGMQFANNSGTLLNNIGSAQAGGAISGANAENAGISGALGGLGRYMGTNNLGSLFANWTKGF